MIAQKIAKLGFAGKVQAGSESSTQVSADTSLADEESANVSEIASISTTTSAAAKMTAVVDTPEVDGSARDGAAVPVRVIVRCRPLATQSDAVLEMKAEPLGRDKVTLKIDGVEGCGAADDVRRRSSRGGARAFKCNAYFDMHASQADLFEQAAPIVERTMEGYNGTIFCYGVTGSGKTYTMSGPPGSDAMDAENEAAGIVQRVSRRIFENIRDGSGRGEIFVVEASFLEVYSSDGKREQLIDLLSTEDKKLEVKRDPNSPESFMCDGLSTVPIKSPDQMCEVLNAGRKRCTYMETTRNCCSSRSHCLFTLTIESLVEQADRPGEPLVRRGKLVLVDLAGSESIKRVQAASDGQEELRRQQAIGINRVLTSLGTVVNNMNIGLSHGHRDSALTMLLHDCLGGNARALLIANIGPEQESLAESVKTLSFAQQMMAVKNVANVNRIRQDQSAIMQMRQRHADCIRILATEAKDEERSAGDEDREKLKKEMDELNKRLLTKESAEETLESMKQDHHQKMQQLREEMAQSINQELEKMRRQSMGDIDSLRQTVTELHNQRQNEDHDARMVKIQANHEEAVSARRVAEEENAGLRVKLASAEERLNMLQERQQEFQKDRADTDAERKAFRQQTEQHWQKVASMEGELQRYKTESASQQAELARVNAARSDDAEAARRDREATRAREEELQREKEKLRGECEEVRQNLADSKRQTELEMLKLQSQSREAAASLQMKIERLESEAQTKSEMLQQAQAGQARLEAEMRAAQQDHESTQQLLRMELEEARDELDQANIEKGELLNMLKEVQESVIARRK